MKKTLAAGVSLFVAQAVFAFDLKAAKTDDLLNRAAVDARTGPLNSHLLMTSAQAALVELTWSLPKVLPDAVARAEGDLERLSGKLKRFVAEVDTADAGSSPIAPFIAELSKSPRVQETAAQVPETESAQVAEIKRLRAGYAGDASRAALNRARAARDELSRRLGAPHLEPRQAQAVALAEDFLKDLRDTRRRLAERTAASKGGASARALVARSLAQIEADASELKPEIERTRIHFELAGYRSAAPELRDAPADKDLGGTDKVSDPDLMGEMKAAEDANLSAALARGTGDALAAVQNALLILDYARDQVVGAKADIKGVRAKGLGFEEQVDALVLAAQMLDAKGRAARAKAAGAGLAVPEADPAEMMTLRAGYRSRDRQRDLKRAEFQLGKAQGDDKGKASEAPEAEQALLSALQDCLSELKSARAALSEAAKALPGPGRDTSRRRLESRGEQIDTDIEDLSRETRLLEIGLSMRRIEAEDFDGTSKKKKKRK